MPSASTIRRKLLDPLDAYREQLAQSYEVENREAVPQDMVGSGTSSRPKRSYLKCGDLPVFAKASRVQPSAEAAEVRDESVLRLKNCTNWQRSRIDCEQNTAHRGIRMAAAKITDRDQLRCEGSPECAWSGLGVSHDPRSECAFLARGNSASD